ncbi:hypothetical protein [Vibrio coralliilyticus]|uniref:hypothetical protein n=1 Tax=Vibrio coralliilyticus TaxID=190893 RepID=UPI00117E9709|nr:hypothetical protein [Vibrio coralliilyticus]
MAKIGMDSSIGGIEFEVAYKQKGIANTRPGAIEVTVSLGSMPNASGVISLLNPDEVHASTLKFYEPLNFDLPDWQHLDISTGCVK